MLFKNSFKILILFCFSSLLFQCDKKEEEPYLFMQITGTAINVTEFGLGDGSINISVTGGAPPFTFLWSNNETTKNLTDLTAGTYTVMVGDQNLNSITDTFEITQPLPDTISIYFKIINPSKTGAVDGKVITNISGGYAPFTFSWSNGMTTKDIENLPADNYILTVNDSRGQVCIDTISINDKLIDIDGNIYTTIKIGEQVWMGENLKVTHAPDNAKITSYLFNNDSTYEEIHGRLYTWNTVMHGSTEEQAQGICPNGWHIPSDNEYKTLEKHLGMTEEESNVSNDWRGAGIGTKLKQGGSSGFNARLSGRRAPSGTYSVMERVEYLWTSTESGANAWRRCIDKFANDVGRWDSFPKTYGFSVRCIKNE